MEITYIENRKQYPGDCCYRDSCGNFCSMRGRNVGNRGRCLEDTGRTSFDTVAGTISFENEGLFLEGVLY
ncbi:hypothetical protein [Eubacterium sp. 14-2]|uniref:hypothetical protein n=1 Tax=Eubacterium sp. 14-2 TaxID=1235790 RepID=UPI0012DC8D57|nr:hypothetical protein [Eubacterium sp. 14-2]